jgi:hypothetical protein
MAAGDHQHNIFGVEVDKRAIVAAIEGVHVAVKVGDQFDFRRHKRIPVQYPGAVSGAASCAHERGPDDDRFNRRRLKSIARPAELFRSRRAQAAERRLSPCRLRRDGR